MVQYPWLPLFILLSFFIGFFLSFFLMMKYPKMFKMSIWFIVDQQYKMKILDLFGNRHLFSLNEFDESKIYFQFDVIKKFRNDEGYIYEYERDLLGTLKENNITIIKHGTF